MQENFENYVFNNDTIKGLYSLDDNELQELCDYLISLFKKEKIVYHVNDVLQKICAIYIEAGLINSISSNPNVLYYNFLYIVMLGISIVIINELYYNNQKHLKLLNSLLKHINNKDLNFLNNIIDNIENDSNDNINVSLNNEFLLKELKKFGIISNEMFEEIIKKSKNEINILIKKLL